VERLDLAGLVEDALASTARLTEALWACDADPDAPYTRVPGADLSFPLHTVGPRRRAEVEIHHGDLGTGYEPSTWPTDFSSHLVKQRQDELAQAGGPSMVLSSTDVSGLWKFGEGQGPEIHGTVGDLAWWLVGRGDGQGLTCSSGELPVLGRWR
jgi:maleylpyruvate isomerase